MQGTVFDYADRHPQPSDICLLVEVADSTLKGDCEVKEKVYAQAAISEYWVIDIPDRQVHVFRDPTPTGYTNHLTWSETQTISPAAFPHLTLPIAAILPPL